MLQVSWTSAHCSSTFRPALTEAFLRTSLLHTFLGLRTSVSHVCMQQVGPEECLRAGQNVDDECPDVQLRRITWTLKWSGPEIDLL